jgi:uncharacterized phiE125 gp8 family phage protein
MATTIDLVLVKSHLRIGADIADEDGYIQALIDAAIVKIEKDTGYRISALNTTYSLDGFPSFNNAIELPLCPVSEVTAIKYIDANDVEQTLNASEYYVNLRNTHAAIFPTYGKYWPTAKEGYETVTVEYSIGASEIEKPLIQAGLLLIGHWYANRESVVTGTISSSLPLAYESLIQPYKVMF